MKDGNEEGGGGYADSGGRSRNRVSMVNAAVEEGKEEGSGCRGGGGGGKGSCGDEGKKGVGRQLRWWGRKRVTMVDAVTQEEKEDGGAGVNGKYGGGGGQQGMQWK